MVGDDAERNIGLFAVTVMFAGNFGNLIGDVAHRIYVEQRAHALHHAGQTLEAHAGVDVLLLQFGVVAVAVVVELREHVVPDLHIAVAVTADRTAGLAAAVLRAAVVVNLRARTARTRTMLPEVILLAETENTFRRDTDILIPDFERLVIIHVDGRIQAVRVNANPLRAGQEFPAPGNGFLLEVIAKREIAQHLEERAMARGLADVFNIARTDALLAGCDAVARRLLLAGEIRFHWRHTGVNQKKRRVVLRNERKTRQAEMAFGLEELQVHFAQFI